MYPKHNSLWYINKSSQYIQCLSSNWILQSLAPEWGGGNGQEGALSQANPATMWSGVELQPPV